MIDVSAVFTAHGEGIFSGPSLRSFEQAIALARADGISVESIIALDCPTKETVRQFAGVEARGHRVVFSDAKDPGGARNAAVQESRAKFVTFLDGDDLWSFNWIVAAREFSGNAAGAIAHSEINLHFGLVSIAVLHVDSENRLFDEDGLRVVNYWDALVFAPRRILLEFPYVKNDMKRRFGHEDWHWNEVTLAAGIPHRPVAGTVHFKRRRKGTQSLLCDSNDVITHPSDARAYTWRYR